MVHNQVLARTDPVAVRTHSLAVVEEDRSSSVAGHSSHDLVHHIAALVEAAHNNLGSASVLLAGKRWAGRPETSTFGST